MSHSFSVSEIMHFSSSIFCLGLLNFIHLYETHFAFRSSKNETSMNMQDHRIMNNCLNFDKYTIAMDKEEFEEKDIT